MRRALVLVASAGLVASVLMSSPASAITDAPTLPNLSTTGTVAAAATPIGTVTNYDLGAGGVSGLVVGPDGNLWYTVTNAIGLLTPHGLTRSFSGPEVSKPRGITAGADGNLWFTNSGNDSIGRITPAGVIDTFTGPGVGQPEGITAGPDGNLWFTNRGNDSIGRITPAGVVANFTGAGVSDPLAIAAGADGNLWFTNHGGDSIGRINPGGVVATFTGTGIDRPNGIASGPDGNLWFANDTSIGMITPAGAVTTFTDAGIGGPRGVASGLDGNVWFTDPGQNRIGRITPGGVVTVLSQAGIRAPVAIVAGPNGAQPLLRATPGADPAPTAAATWIGAMWFVNAGAVSIGWVWPTDEVRTHDARPNGPGGITAGPDGNLWFVQGDSIGRITPDGVSTSFTGPGVRATWRIAAGADGNLWFTDVMGQSIGRITPSGAISTFTAPGMGTPVGIAAGADGNVWFTSYGLSYSVGRITPEGIITLFSTIGFGVPQEIAAGPDGNLWFTTLFDDAIVRVTLDGEMTMMSGPNAPGINTVAGLTAGPDGNVWFTNVGSIGRITPSGDVDLFSGTGIANARSIAAGPDGNLWFTNTNNASIGRITPDGVVSNFKGDGIASPERIASGPDGGMWFANPGNRTIGRITAANLPGPPPATYFHPTPPTRLLDSRGATGGWSAPLVAGAPKGLTVAGGSSGVPADARAVILNVTVTGGTTDSFLTAYPAGGSVPQSSNVNFAEGQTIPNLVTVAVGAGGQVAFSNAAGSVDVVADIAGYFDEVPADRFNALDPSRILDSRDGTGGWPGKLGAGSPRTLTVSGVNAAVPPSATAVILNVTVTEATTDSFLTVYPAGASPPVASNLNFAEGQTTSNLVTVELGPGGQLAFVTSAGAVDVVVDVAGYFDPSSGDLFHALAPTRLLDSRGSTGGWPGPLAAGAVRVLAAPGHGGVAHGATAIIANTTVTGATADSFLTVFPGGTIQPPASNLNFAAGQTIPNLVAVKLGPGGYVGFANALGATDVIVDVAGYFAPT